MTALSDFVGRGLSTRRKGWLARQAASLAWLALLPVGLAGVTLPSGFSQSRLANGLANPTAMAIAPDGRIFICQQGGKLRVVKNGSLLSASFLTVTVSSSGERGLLGVAFDPGFPANPYVYVYYTATSPSAHNRVSRFTANGDVAVSGSEVILLELDDLSAAYHNGGALHFGPDGMLYVATGDNTNSANAQNLNNLLGKILRLHPDGSVPTDNPFYSTASGKNRAIWALGLRNPFTFSIQPGTGKMLINDVGAATWEEVNEGIAGANYGWPNEEGPGSDARYEFPVHEYPHGNGSGIGCAITGGVFYDPSTAQFPASYVGNYFFADYCSGWIERLDPDNGYARSTFVSGITQPVDLKVGNDGSLYYLARGSGSTTGVLYRIQYGGNNPPAITQHPAGVTVSAGQPAAFSVSASGTPPLTYQWQRNGTNISGATSSSYTLSSAQPSDSGAVFRCRVTNSYGTATSNGATLTVTSNGLPNGSITQPAAGSLYAAGDTISYSGTGSDPEDGTLPASAFEWQVDFHHDTHTHPFVAPTTGSKTGSFTIPTEGETSANVWYRLYLTVRDSSGAGATSYVDILPRKVTLALQASPAGATVTLDGQPVTPPASVVSVVGMTRSLGAVSPQAVAGANWEFDSWSDGAAATHSIATPAASTNFAAVYRVLGGVTGNGVGLDATFWDNSDFTGSTVERVDPTVAFDWGSAAPAAGIGADTFSARWSGEVQAQFTETYTFYTVSDDGVRLWVNGQLLIDNWTDHASTENQGTIALAAGQKYVIRMDFYEKGGGAVARLLWSSPSTPKSVIPRSQLYAASTPPPPPGGSGTGLTGEYFDNQDFTLLKVTRVDPTVNFSWGSGSPASGVGKDTFSVRWTGQVEPEFSETYSFYTVSDDGVRLWVNGQLLIDNWTDHASTEDQGTIALAAGQRYDIQIDFYEKGGGAVAKLLWSSASTPKSVIPTSRLYDGSQPPPPPPGGSGLTGEYFDNQDFTLLKVTRVDPAVNFSWGSGSPASGVGNDTFSVRWSGQVEAQSSETYTFYTVSDDGVRLWVNGQLLIDNWTDHASTEDQGTITLEAGQRYDIQIDFYEKGGGAVAKLLWSSASTPKAAITAERLYPSP